MNEYEQARAEAKERVLARQASLSSDWCWDAYEADLDYIAWCEREGYPVVKS